MVASLENQVVELEEKLARVKASVSKRYDKIIKKATKHRDSVFQDVHAELIEVGGVFLKDSSVESFLQASCAFRQGSFTWSTSQVKDLTGLYAVNSFFGFRTVQFELSCAVSKGDSELIIPIRDMLGKDLEDFKVKPVYPDEKLLDKFPAKGFVFGPDGTQKSRFVTIAKVKSDENRSVSKSSIHIDLARIEKTKLMVSGLFYLNELLYPEEWES